MNIQMRIGRLIKAYRLAVNPALGWGELMGGGGRRRERKDGQMKSGGNEGRRINGWIRR